MGIESRRNFWIKYSWIWELKKVKGFEKLKRIIGFKCS